MRELERFLRRVDERGLGRECFLDRGARRERIGDFAKRSLDRELVRGDEALLLRFRVREVRAVRTAAKSCVSVGPTPTT